MLYHVGGRLSRISAFQNRELRKAFHLRPTRLELGNNFVVLFFRKMFFGEVTYESFFGFTVSSKEGGEFMGTSKESHAPSRHQRVFDLRHKRSFTAMFGCQLKQHAVTGRRYQQRRKQDSLFHRLMILIRENSQEFQDGGRVTNFNSLAILQLFQHSINDI